MGDHTQVWKALREGAARLCLEHRGLVRIEGAETADLLHRVTSQHTTGMAVGAGAPACILTGKGKLLAYFELFRPREDLFLAELDRDRLPAFVELVDRFIFAERIEVADTGLTCAGVFGPEAPARAGGATSGVVSHGGGWLLASEELGVPGVRFHGPAGEVAAFCADVGPAGGFADYEALRIDAGKPRYGLDADDSTIPLEVGLDAACHRDKGCYIGQEIVARIDTYGHVNRQLCRVEIASGEAPEPGTLVFDEDVEAGRVTSAYAVPGEQRVRGLALLPAVLADGETPLALGEGGGPAVRVL